MKLQGDGMKASFIHKQAVAYAITISVCLPVMAEEEAPKKAEQLQDITVQATRVDKSLYEIPASVGYVGKDDIQFGRQQLGLDESMNKIPGIFMQNRHNFNQDLSISIRGFGISEFGIRGVKVFVDGIPGTLPDGQGGIDNIDIGSTDRIEVIRGPSSSLYGSASGGVINLYTEDGTDIPFVEGRVLTGSYGFNQQQIKAGGQKDSINYLVSVSRLDYEGFRPHSHTERNLFNSKLRWDIDNTSDMTFIFNVLDKPIAEDPGSINRAQLENNYRSARAQNITFDSEETVDQQQIGVVYRKAFNEKHETTARNYYVIREFDNKLPFGAPFNPGGMVAFDRFFVGGGLQHVYTDQFFGHSNRLSFGFDIDSQMDKRKNFQNINGAMGALSLNQDEDVFSWGAFLQNEFAITGNLDLTFGVRYDVVEFEFSDKFLADGSDDSGKIEFKEWSPQVGLLWKVHEAVNLYGSVSTSFETPTSTEFSVPAGGGGFNSGLDAQTATNYEIGVKGVLPGRVTYQVSLFTADVSNEILPAGINPFGNVFFNNAGESSRTGVEAGVAFRPLQNLEISLAYTYSDFEFESFVDPTIPANFTGNKIPGAPEQFGNVEIAYYHPSGLYGVFDAQIVDRIFVDNANSDAAEGYTVANFRAGYTTYIGDTEFTPFFGVNNIFNRKYVGNVRINDGFGRFFDPAPELNVFAGISLTFR
jgi:iron complex outermembrane receptor protein